jgi:hypothetical protein
MDIFGQWVNVKKNGEWLRANASLPYEPLNNIRGMVMWVAINRCILPIV